MSAPPVHDGWLARLAPGLAALLRYRAGDFPHDLVAGLSVAAVALPVGVAYAELAGFSPVVGLYSTMLPMVLYALFGTSRQLIVGPDAATCALVAAAAAPLAAGNAALYPEISGALAALAGLFCIGACFLRLGALADFLSKPILVGFLNGISLHILVGQLGKLFGFPVDAKGIIRPVFEVLGKIQLTHWPTLAVGLATFAVLLVSPRLLPKAPPALVALVVAGALVAAFGLDAYGISTIGAVPAGLPTPVLPLVPFELLDQVLVEAAGLALVSFSSMMLTARSFAAKNRYEIDVNREFAALGAANLGAALTQGFAISGADSRTAMADAAGGRTQVTGIVAALAVAAVLLFLTTPLAWVPIAALGAILVKASLSLLDLKTLKRLYALDKEELVLSLLATFGVIWFGAVQAIGVVVALAVLRFLRSSSRPRVHILGRVEGLSGFHALAHFPGAKTVDGLLLFRFDAPLVFFNAGYFKQQAKAAINDAGPGLKWFVLDALPITQIDVTGFYALEDLIETLRERGAELVIAGRIGAFREGLAHAGVREAEFTARLVPTMRQALRDFKALRGTDGDATAS